MSNYQFSQILEAMLSCFVGTVLAISIWGMIIVTEIRKHSAARSNKTEDL